MNADSVSNEKTENNTSLCWRGWFYAAICINAILFIWAIYEYFMYIDFDTTAGDSGSVDQVFCNVTVLITGKVFAALSATFFAISVTGALLRKTSWALSIIVILSVIFVLSIGPVLMAH